MMHPECITIKTMTCIVCYGTNGLHKGSAYKIAIVKYEGGYFFDELGQFCGWISGLHYAFRR